MRWSSFLYSVHGSNNMKFRYSFHLPCSQVILHNNAVYWLNTNTGTFNVHELFWTLQLQLVVAIQLVFCVKLGIAVHEWKRSAESVLMLNIHFPVFPWYIWSKLNKLLTYKKYQLTKRWLEGKFEGFFRVS